MAFITLRRSRNTRSYYLVESYRDERGASRKRTLCYLGREQDATDTLEKALAHWERIKQETDRDLRSAQGLRLRILQDRKLKAAERIELLRRHVEAEAGRRRSVEARAQEFRRIAEESEHWQALDRLRRLPSAENAQAAKRAFRALAMRLHPDQGGSHEAFIRLKHAYDFATETWQRRAGR